MMKRISWITLSLIFSFLACKDEDINLFDKSGDERTLEAIAALKADLVAQENGWILRYKPIDETGSYNVLLDFNDDNTVTIQSDFTADDGAYFEQSNTYRIDSSLGLELIIETYSLFSYLFERDQATFLAEYEFDYVNKTPDGALVFNSKSDFSDPTIVMLEPANADDVVHLGLELAPKLDSLADDFFKITTSVRLSLPTKDLAFDGYFDVEKRTINFWTVSSISNSNNNNAIAFVTGYYLDGNSVVFDQPLTETFLGNSISIERLELTTLTHSSIDACGNAIPINGITGSTSEGTPAILQSTISDISGKNFPEVAVEFAGPINFIFNQGFSAAAQISQDIVGAEQMVLLYGYVRAPGDTLNGIGFLIDNPGQEPTFALREFKPELVNNHLVFNFISDEISIYNNPQTTANIENINIYVNALTQGDQTYVFKIVDNVYEFYNPCSNWSFVFVGTQ
jgi:hypothetical protein